jgi:hypothetical protein
MRAGRPCKLNPELQKQICDIILDGNYRDVAAVAVGISKSSLAHWIMKGKRQDKGKYRDFLKAILKAEKDAEIAKVREIYLTAAKEPANARWWLERKFPHRWGPDRGLIEKLTRQVEEAEINVRALGALVDKITAQQSEGHQEDGETGNGRLNGHV